MGRCPPILVFIGLAVALLALTLSQSVCAQTRPSPDSTTTYGGAIDVQKQADKERTWGWRASYEIGHVTFNRDATTAMGVSQGAWSLIRFGGGFDVLKHLLVEGGAGILHLKDERRFTQTVVGGYPDPRPRDEKSRILAIDGYLGLGITRRVGKRLRVEGLIGKTGFDATRTIALCSNCREEKVLLQGDFFIQPRLRIGRSGNFALSYRQYVGRTDAVGGIFLGYIYTNE